MASSQNAAVDPAASFVLWQYCDFPVHIFDTALLSLFCTVVEFQHLSVFVMSQGGFVLICRNYAASRVFQYHSENKRKREREKERKKDRKHRNRAEKEQGKEKVIVTQNIVGYLLVADSWPITFAQTLLESRGENPHGPFFQLVYLDVYLLNQVFILQEIVAQRVIALHPGHQPGESTHHHSFMNGPPIGSAHRVPQQLLASAITCSPFRHC